MVTVLVVDNEPGMRKVMRQVLATTGCTVIEAADGGTALKLFRSRVPDIVITDVIMPDMTGIEVIAAMKKERPEVKIIAITGGGRALIMDFLPLAHKAGADATLEKPFRNSDLLDLAVKLLAERYDSHREIA